MYRSMAYDGPIGDMMSVIDKWLRQTRKEELGLEELGHKKTLSDCIVLIPTGGEEIKRNEEEAGKKSAS